MRKLPARLIGLAAIPQNHLRGFVFTLLLILLGYLGWLVTRIAHQPTHIAKFDHLGLAGLSLILAILIQRGLVAFNLAETWSYRLGFLGTSLVFSGIEIQIALSQATPPRLSWILTATGGAFLGSLLLTGMRQNLWENNSPPSLHIRQEVERLHQEVIGSPPSTPFDKRLFDLIFALVGFVISAPIWLLCIVLVWLEDPGPLLFIKNSVGKGGVNFHQLKFRTMVKGAEDLTGPVLASGEDPRVLYIGRLLRKSALDELPQLINILRGQMSFVGPRPQRTILVQDYLQEMPDYAERHKVLPGLAGLAQVVGDYYLTPRQKLRFDRLYIHHASLGFDLKLILLAFLITFWLRWRRGWNGRLPRALLRWGSKKVNLVRSFARPAPQGKPGSP